MDQYLSPVNWLPQSILATASYGAIQAASQSNVGQFLDIPYDMVATHVKITPTGKQEEIQVNLKIGNAYLFQNSQPIEAWLSDNVWPGYIVLHKNDRPQVIITTSATWTATDWFSIAFYGYRIGQ